MNQKEFHAALSSMPELHHTLPGHSFDADKSEVVQWIMSRPGFKNWVFARATSSGRIEYDPGSGTWSGVVRGPVGRPKSPDGIRVVGD